MVEMTNAGHAQVYRLLAGAISELAGLVDLTNTGFNAAAGQLITADGVPIEGLSEEICEKIGTGAAASLELDDAIAMLSESAELLLILADQLDPQ